MEQFLICGSSGLTVNGDRKEALPVPRSLCQYGTFKEACVGGPSTYMESPNSRHQPATNRLSAVPFRIEIQHDLVYLMSQNRT